MSVMITRADGTSPWPGFRDLETAIAFKVDRGLDLPWRLDDRRDLAPEIHPRETILACGAMIRDHLQPLWRRTQFDRLSSGRIPALPARSSAGMGRATAQAGKAIFELSGWDGWSAIEGSHVGRRLSGPHGWLLHRDGYLLDMAADQFGLPAVSIAEAADVELLNAYRTAQQMGPPHPGFLTWAEAQPDLVKSVTLAKEEILHRIRVSEPEFFA